MSDSIVIVSAARTPMVGFQGDFSSLAAHDLGGAAIKAAVERAALLLGNAAQVTLELRIFAAQQQRQGIVEILAAAPLAHVVVPAVPAPGLGFAHLRLVGHKLRPFE